MSRRITKSADGYRFEGRPFAFDVEGPMHHDDACDAEVTEVYFLDGDGDTEALVGAIYDELQDEIFARATTP